MSKFCFLGWSSEKVRLPHNFWLIPFQKWREVWTNYSASMLLLRCKPLTLSNSLEYKGILKLTVARITFVLGWRYCLRVFVFPNASHFNTGPIWKYFKFLLNFFIRSECEVKSQTCRNTSYSNFQWRLSFSLLTAKVKLCKTPWLSLLLVFQLPMQWNLTHLLLSSYTRGLLLYSPSGVFFFLTSTQIRRTLLINQQTFYEIKYPA